MFFKNLLLYRITQSIDLSADTLEAALATKQARACANQELTTYGFTAPLGKGEDAPLVHVSGDFLLICARKEERILPGSVVRDAVKEKVEEIEAEQMRKVYKKERDQIKDEIIQAFLPRAFIRRSATFAAIAPKLGLIFVNSPSPKRAEDLLSTLREVIGSLPVRPLTVKMSPTASMTEWLTTQKAADDFFVLDECELRDTHEDGGVVRCKRQDMAGGEIQTHLSTGKVVTQLSMAWQDKLSFVLDDKMVIKRLKFEDLLVDQAEQDGGDDALGQLDASFTLMMLTFANFIPALLQALGGEEIPDGLASTSAPEDELLPAAIAFVRVSRRATVAALQRHFNINYNRGARLIERMQADGVVSPANDKGARTVL
ncbi:recombination-associated protein RdgC [Pseudomonas sp. SWRI74]|uniref:Recombination-associated protein RdgC n=1 Tax=Pseudomonas azerbaijanoccidentalis TaxID=2842347 RepID=A0ABS6QZH0_9PSED|nr:recombination-associated protein RdgC [Pseudomonas azerbaijanoccidentalis]